MSIYRGPSVLGTSSDTTHAMVLAATAAALDAASSSRVASAAELVVVASELVVVEATATAVAAAASLDSATLVRKTSVVGAVLDAVGTTAERPSPVYGMSRTNSTLNLKEWWDGSKWAPLGGGAVGGLNNPAFFENDAVITQSYTVSTGTNAGSFGPISVNPGVTVTVPSGSTWTIT